MPPCPRCREDAPSGARFCPACGEALAGRPAKHVRKRVTVVFADIAGSTPLGDRLDAESVRGMMARYFDEARAVFERHGGMVEKFIGDAVVAAFGIPTLHDDDALRAVKAALELRDRLAELNSEMTERWGVRLEVRMSVNTGEVVAGNESDRQAFATGDAVNVGARLEQAAAPGEILIGSETYDLVRDAVLAESVDPLLLRGKAQPVPAWRLLGGRPEIALERRREAPFIGRESELAQLHAYLEDAAVSGAGRLVTVIAPPGVGKSRLTREFLARVGGRARVVVGRCPSYGEGITYLPLAGIVEEAGGAEIAGLRKLVGHDESGELVVAGVAGALGLGDEDVRTEEIFWAVRRLLEILAQGRPLIAVIDDIHWAEPTFLDLLEYAATFAQAPILLLCLARPDLLEARPGWALPRPNASLLALDTLSDSDAAALVERLLGGAELSEVLRSRILDAAEGNPLFVEQMLALAREDGSGEDELVVPPTIQALLAARIDRLAPGERAVAERASIQGRVFHRGAVSSLLPEAERDRLATNLMALVRKEFIRPDTSRLAGEDTFRFGHVLIRDAAYAAMPKDLRAQLHERFAGWLEQRSGDGEEVVGYHLEQAVRYRSELEHANDATRRLAERGAEHLGTAGRRAAERGDVPAAANLFERAVSLLPPDSERRLELLVDLGGALGASGELARAESLLEEVFVRAKDERLRSHAVLERSFLRRYTHPEAGADELLAVAEHAIRVFDRGGDDAGLSRAWRLVGEVHWTRCQIGLMESALRHAEHHALRAGEPHEIHLMLDGSARAALIGPTPVDDAIGRCLEIEEQGSRRRTLQAAVTAMRAYLEAMRGNLDEARTLAAHSTAIFEELGEVIYLAAMQAWIGEIEMLAGDFAAAERSRRAGFDALDAVGERGILSTVAAYLAETLYAEERYAEALHFTEVSERYAASDDSTSQILWRTARAKVFAKNGDQGQGVKLAREAVALAGETDCLNLQGDALLSLAVALAAEGERDRAESARSEAVGRYEAKGNIVSAATARRSALTETAGPADRAS